MDALDLAMAIATAEANGNTLFPKERFGLVTGSRCSPLVPAKDAKAGMISLAKELGKEKAFGFTDKVSTWQMEHGKMNQHLAFEHFKRFYDKDIFEGEFGFDGNVGWSPDAEGEGYGIDFKCPTSLENFLEYLSDGVSKKEFDQCQHYMMGRKKDKWLIAAYLTETIKMMDVGEEYPIAEEKRMILVEVNKSNEWQEKFHSNLPFLVKNRDVYFEMYNLQFNTPNVKLKKVFENAVEKTNTNQN